MSSAARSGEDIIYVYKLWEAFWVIEAMFRDPNAGSAMESHYTVTYVLPTIYCRANVAGC